MKRTLFLIVAVAAVLALPATASAFRGVAVAKDQARHAIVTASANGVVRTVRAPGRAGAVRLGHRLVFTARRLADGTFRAGTVRVGGKARHALVRGIVVRNQRKLHRLLLSAGGSVIAVRAGRGFASHRGPGPGDRVEVRVVITARGLVGNGLNDLGHANALELEGIFLGLTDSGQLRLAVVHRGEVFVNVPEGFQLPQLRPGDEIEILVSVDEAGAFTLVKIRAEDEDEDEDEVEVRGEITALLADLITVEGRHDLPVTCAIPKGVDLSRFDVGDEVEMRCEFVGATLTLTRLKTEDDDDDDHGGHDGGGHGGHHHG